MREGGRLYILYLPSFLPAVSPPCSIHGHPAAGSGSVQGSEVHIAFSAVQCSAHNVIVCSAVHCVLFVAIQYITAKFILLRFVAVQFISL